MRTRTWVRMSTAVDVGTVASAFSVARNLMECPAPPSWFTMNSIISYTLECKDELGFRLSVGGRRCEEAMERDAS